MIQIKDDTFTANKKRVLELCCEIRHRKLRFLWSCDTRVDVLTEDLLYEMRLAGCERLSLGVESGSPTILKNIDKKITIEDIVRSTEAARKFGIQVRYYMMLGNRGETLETFADTLEFLQIAKPHQYLFSCLSIYPGTRDFDDAEKDGWLDREAYFTSDFQELKTPYDADEETTRVTAEWFQAHKGLREFHRESVDDYRAILSRLGDHAPAFMDLGAALYRAGEFDEAQVHIRHALELDHPLPGLAYNYLACICLARGEYHYVFDHLQAGIERDPQHLVLLQNYERAQRWQQEGGPAKGLPLHLRAAHDFQLLERSTQPTLPGALEPDFARWGEVEVPSPMVPLRPAYPTRS
jgi:tetratricopeptide (TPR) repeat protein